jgi:ankyrin repeat protein
MVLEGYPDNRDTIIDQLNEFIDDGETDVNLVVDGWSAIHLAAYNRDEDLLKFLAKKGADLEATIEDANQNICHLIFLKPRCDQRTFSLVEKLTEDLDEDLMMKPNIAGQTPYHLLAKTPLDSSRLNEHCIFYNPQFLIYLLV